MFHSFLQFTAASLLVSSLSEGESDYPHNPAVPRSPTCVHSYWESGERDALDWLRVDPRQGGDVVGRRGGEAPATAAQLHDADDRPGHGHLRSLQRPPFRTQHLGGRRPRLHCQSGEILVAIPTPIP